MSKPTPVAPSVAPFSRPDLQESAAESRRLSYASILEDLPAGVIALDREQRTSFVNRAALRALGHDRREGELPSLEDLLGSDELAKTVRDSLAEGRESRLVFFRRRADGETAEIGLGVMPVQGAHDISAVLMMRSLDEGRALDERAQRIERLAAVGRLAAGLAHEVRNPIAAIQGLVEGLADEGGGEGESAAYAERIQRQIHRINSLINSCLALGPRATATDRLDPRVLLERVLGRTAGGDRIGRCFAEDLDEIQVDGRQIEEGLEALLSNALEACDGDSSKVSVGLRNADPGRVLIEVADHGAGIPSHLTEQIFEPFFTTKPQATGLGLASARMAALRNDGFLELFSAADLTVFTLSLPAANPEAASR